MISLTCGLNLWVVGALAGKYSMVFEGVDCLHLIALWLKIVVASLSLAHPVLRSHPPVLVYTVEWVGGVML